MKFNFRDIATISTVLFAIIDIIGSIPVVIEFKKKSGIIKPLNITIMSGAIMLLFLFLGTSILDLIGIDVKSFAIAGSLILFLIALEMLLGIKIYKTEMNESSNIVPIAFPLIAGAGTLTTLLSLRAEYELQDIVIAIIINLFIVYVTLRNIYRIEKLLGEAGINILRKVFSVILLALAVKLFKTNA